MFDKQDMGETQYGQSGILDMNFCNSLKLHSHNLITLFLILRTLEENGIPSPSKIYIHFTYSETPIVFYSYECCKLKSLLNKDTLSGKCTDDMFINYKSFSLCPGNGNSKLTLV